MDKLDETYSIRIPSCLKDHLDKMPEEIKQQMHREIRELMARSVHSFDFKCRAFPQHKECLFYLASVNEKHKNCLMFRNGRCFSQDAKKAAIERFVAAVKGEITPGRMDE